MGDKTKISWTDSTFNAWEGCTKISPGCSKCYALTRDQRYHGGAHWGPGAPRREVISAIPNALKWNAAPFVCDECGEAAAVPRHEEGDKCQGTRWHRRRVFAMSLGDLFDEEVDVSWLINALRTIATCTALDFQVLTKRPENFHDRMDAARRVAALDDEPHLTEWIADWLNGRAPENVWLGFSAENQEWFVKRYALARELPTRLLFVSAEPLLDEIFARYALDEGRIKWVIAGGESGEHARPCRLEWLNTLRRECGNARVPFFAKQLGINVQSAFPHQYFPERPFRAAAPGSDLKQFQMKDTRHGADLKEFPFCLQVREFPIMANPQTEVNPEPK